MADTSLPPPALTAQQISDGLLYPGAYWSSAQLTYSIPDATSAWPGYKADQEPFTGYAPVTPAVAAAFRQAAATWDSLIAPHLVETDDHTAPGNIRIAFSSYSDLDESFGYATSPPYKASSPLPRNGDIWINAKEATASYAPGSYDYQALMHEFGHTLGLKHPFEDPALPAPYDNHLYTIMSYTDQPGTYAMSLTPLAGGGVQAVYTPVWPTTPMVLDIAAVQSVYGADPATAAGNDTYAFSQDQPFLKTIYDAGGADTIDLSNLTRPSNLDLTPGAYSSIAIYTADQQIADLLARYQAPEYFVRALFADAPRYTWTDNLGIAFSTTIENAFGGSGSDTLTGNLAANWLVGGAGNDFMRGMDGADAVDGGAGDDDVNGNMGGDYVTGGAGADSVRGGQGDDSVFGGDGDDGHVNGNLGNDVVHGDAGNDTVYGGQGADLVYGDDGNDQLSGDLGTDTLYGGAGADRFLLTRGTGADLVEDFSSAAGDRIQIAAGVAYTVTADPWSQAVISVGAGDQITLAGVTVAAMGDWLVVA